MACGIHASDTGADYSDRPSANLQRRFVRSGVYAVGEPGDDRDPRSARLFATFAAMDRPRCVALRDPTTDTPISSARNSPLTNSMGGI